MKVKTAILFIVLAIAAFPNIVLAVNGYFLHGVGAVNDATGGAATAGNSQDLLGSLYRNPANCMLFENKSASVSLGALFPNVTVNSSVEALNLSGSSDSDVDAIPLGSLGMVFNDKDRRIAYYFAIIAEAGLHNDVPESTVNPIFMKQAGKPGNLFGGLFGGFGALETQLEVVRIPLGIAFQFDNKWSAGFSVAPSVERMKFTPAVFAAPDDANGDGIPTYPTDVNHELAFGIGFQAGIRYQFTDKLGFGFSLTSPTWFDKFEWDVKDESGNKRSISQRLNRPLSFSLGTAYRLMTDTLLLMDISWINYSNTEGFEETGFNQYGALKGIGWDDIWVLSLGIQQDITDSLTIRIGYNYGNNPIDDDLTFFNAGTPLHNKHHLSLGGSWIIFNHTVLDIGYTHAFESSQSGPWYDMSGPVPGTEIESKLEYDQLTMGVTFSF